jgi:4,5-dihydroxyphthalate decarboxylase
MTAPLVLRTAIGNHDHTKALKDGTVKSDRLRLEFVEVEPVTRAFRRMARDLEFDVTEMALTTHALAHAFAKPITALPIVLTRDFHHGAIVCAKGSALRSPKDLAGRKVGVRAYSVTTGVWVRGILMEEYGADYASMTWVTQEDAHVAEYRDPPNVVRAAPGKDMLAMLLAGEIDAAVALRPANPDGVRTVIPDADQAAAAWYRKTGVYPVNHVVSIKTELLRAHPWLGVELFALFKEAKRRAAPSVAPAGSAKAKLRELIGGDLLPYGMAPNRKAIEMLLGFAAEQKLTPRAYAIDELFDASTLALS